jgi:phosphate transport system permease protein
VPKALQIRAAITACWLAGLSLIAIVGFIVIDLAVKGLGAVSWEFLTTPASASESINAGLQGGVRDQIVGTLLLILGGIAIAAPIGIGTAIFLAEYRRPAWLARAAETSLEVIFGVPAVIFALFGVAIFTNPQFIFLSDEVGSSGLAYGKSFFVASTMMAMLALPLVVRSTQEAMRAVSQVQREASYALGKSRFTTIRRIVLPSSRAGIATGVILGIGRIAGDTAIVFLLLGGTLAFGSGAEWFEPGNWGDTLQNTGGSLTSYVYFASPVGEGNSEEKSYGAAFVLVVIMVLINLAVSLIARRTVKGMRA